MLLHLFGRGQFSYVLKVVTVPLPVEWSQAQKDHRQRMGEAARYASAAVADLDLRPIYVQMAVENNMNPDRPFDMAVSDYWHTGNDLLWKKHMGDQEKPKNWERGDYPWYFRKKNRPR